MRRSIRFLALGVLCVAPAFASAQVYKWVDEKGVVNYSSQPPAHRKSSLLDPNSVSVSIYTPAAAPAPAAAAIPSEKALTERIASLERKLDAERYARQSLVGSQAAAIDMQYERCLRDRRIDCDYAGFNPEPPAYASTIVVFRPGLRPRPHVRTRPALAPKPSRPWFAPSRGINAAAPTLPSGIRPPRGRTGDLL